MTIIKSFAVATAGLALSVVASQAQLSLNFSSSPGGSTIQFNGTNSSFQFDPATTPVSIPPFGSTSYYIGSQWTITSVFGGAVGPVTANGLLGVVNNGPFNYGSITISGSDQSADVTGPLGGLVINDSAGFNLTGNVDWIQVSTHDVGGSIGINALLTINITGLSYGGSNPDLQALAASGLGGMDLTFQFAPGKTLTDLSSGSGPYQTSFSGSISPVPEPASSCFLLGLGVLACIQRLKTK